MKWRAAAAGHRVGQKNRRPILYICTRPAACFASIGPLEQFTSAGGGSCSFLGFPPHPPLHCRAQRLKYLSLVCLSTRNWRTVSMRWHRSPITWKPSSVLLSGTQATGSIPQIFQMGMWQPKLPPRRSQFFRM